MLEVGAKILVMILDWFLKQKAIKEKNMVQYEKFLAMFIEMNLMNAKKRFEERKQIAELEKLWAAEEIKQTK